MSTRSSSPVSATSPSARGSNLLSDDIAARIRREGPISFADFQAAALDDEREGFFSTSGGAGRAGADFITSPEVGSLFGALVARHLDAAWRALEEPDPFVVIEAGAGRGRLAADVLRAQPACAPALRYVLVERSARLRGEHVEHLTVEPPDEALGPFTRASAPDEPDEPVPCAGPIVTALAELPAIHVDGVVIANELLDNLPVHLVQRRDLAWLEVRVGLDDDGALVEELVPAAPALTSEADRVAAGTEVPDGARLPVPDAARAWLEATSTLLHRGQVIVIDYAADVADLVVRGPDGPSGWLRTYRAHVRGGPALDAPGSQDITCDLPLEYLRAAAQRAGFTVERDTTQAEWLRALGIDRLVEEGAATWDQRAHLGDLEAIAGRSRGVESAALTDPSGLGSHRVLVLARR